MDFKWLSWETVAEGHPLRKGYHTVGTGPKRWHSVVDVGKELQMELHNRFDYLAQWEIARWIHPQGPLKVADLEEHLSGYDTSLMQCDREEMYDVLQKLVKALYPVCECPLRTPQSFWSALNQHGGYDECEAKGVLIFRAILEVNKAGKIAISLAPPTIGGSRRLWRRNEARRLIRIKLHGDSFWVASGSTSTGSHTLQNFLMPFPLQILGQQFSCFHQKDGSLFYFATHHGQFDKELGPPISNMSLPSFVNTLIPFSNGENDEMSMAKFSARINLWLSKSLVEIPVEEVRWVPDITSYTLPISFACMQQLSAALKLKYTPSCIMGHVKNRSFQYAIRADAPANKFAIYDWMLTNSVKKFSKMAGHEEACSLTLSCRYGKTYKERTNGMSFRCAEVEIWPEPSSAEVVMSDGNATMSLQLAKRIKDALALDDIPVAAQARIEGCKGLWTLPPKELLCLDESVWIEVRESQVKYVAPSNAPWEFEVLAVSSPSPPQGLGAQMIHTLVTGQQDVAKCEAIHERLADLQRQQMTIAAKPLLEVSKTCSDAELRKEIETRERVFERRLLDHGLERKERFVSCEVEDRHILTDSSEPMFDPQSGRPVSFAERAIEMLDSGMRKTPEFIRVLETITAQDIKQDSEKLRIPVGKSRYLFACIDPSGRLEAGEIYCQLSNGMFHDPVTGLRMGNVIQGEVLVTRSPCVQPSDVQKVTARDVPELQHFVDVIVCSSKTNPEARLDFPLLAALGGGDYDGDCCNIIWDTSLCDAWENNHPADILPDPVRFESTWMVQKPPELAFKENGKQEQTARIRFRTVAELEYLVPLFSGTAAKKFPYKLRIDNHHLSKILLWPLFIATVYQSLAKINSSMKECLGAFHPATILSGRLFALALDAAKAGRVFRKSFGEIAAELRVLSISPLPKEDDSMDIDLTRGIKVDIRPNEYESDEDTLVESWAHFCVDNYEDDDDAEYTQTSDNDDHGDDDSDASSASEELHSTQADEQSIIDQGLREAGGNEPSQRRLRSRKKQVSPHSKAQTSSSFSASSPIELMSTPSAAVSLSFFEQLIQRATQWYDHAPALRTQPCTLRDVDMLEPARMAVEMSIGCPVTKQYCQTLRKHVEGIKEHYQKAYKPALSAKMQAKNSAAKEPRTLANAVRYEYSQRLELITAFRKLPDGRPAGWDDQWTLTVAASLLYQASSCAWWYNDLPYLVAWRILLNWKADCEEQRTNNGMLPARRIIHPLYQQLGSRARISNIPLVETIEEISSVQL